MTNQYLSKEQNQSTNKEVALFLNTISVSKIFAVIILCYLVLSFISNQYIFKEEVYFRSFSQKMANQDIGAFLQFKEHYNWLSYLFLIPITFLKVTFATACICVGLTLSSIQFEFKIVFKTILIAEIIFVVGQIIYTINLFYNREVLTLDIASGLYPLTILSYLASQNVVEWIKYPLQTANLFEVFYVITISWLLSKQWKPNFVESLNIVIPSYGLGLLLWVTLVAFLTLQVS